MKIIGNIKSRFKGYMLAGMAVLVPLIGTYLILKFIITSADQTVLSILPERFHPDVILGMNIPGIGFMATLVLIFIVGILTRLYIGRLFVRAGDAIISKIPFGRGIYGGIKKIMSALLSDKSDKFKGVAAVEYPRRDCWVLGFITGDAADCVKDISDDALVNVFIPTTPNPTSGFLIMLPKKDVHSINIGVDEAFKIIISGGIIADETSKAIPNSN